MKTDARVKYTKMVLKNALLELMKEKTVNRITVREVCDKAGLNRATFYTHYADCFALLESIENDLFRDFELSMEKCVPMFDITKLVTAIYDIIEKNEEVCRVLIFGRRSTTLLHKMIDYAHDLSIASWRAKLGKAKSRIWNAVSLPANGLLCVVVDGYDRSNKEAMIRFVNRVFISGYAAYMGGTERAAAKSREKRTER